MWIVGLHRRTPIGSILYASTKWVNVNPLSQGSLTAGIPPYSCHWISLYRKHSWSSGMMTTRPSMLWVWAQLRLVCLYPWARYLILICFIDLSKSGRCLLWDTLQSKCWQGVHLASCTPRWSKMTLIIFLTP